MERAVQNRRGDDEHRDEVHEEEERRGGAETRRTARSTSRASAREVADHLVEHLKSDRDEERAGQQRPPRSVPVRKMKRNPEPQQRERREGEHRGEQARPVPRNHQVSAIYAPERAHPAGEGKRPQQRFGLRRGLVPDERMNELHRLRARESRPEQERHADRKSHHESECAERAASPIALVIAPGRPPPSDSFLGTVSVAEAERASDDQAERQQPQEEPIGEPAGEDGRRDPTVAFCCPDGTASATCRSVAPFALALAAVIVVRARSERPAFEPSSRSSAASARRSSTSLIASLPRDCSDRILIARVPAVPAARIRAHIGLRGTLLSLRILGRLMKKTAASAADVMSEEMMSEASGSRRAWSPPSRRARMCRPTRGCR